MTSSKPKKAVLITVGCCVTAGCGMLMLRLLHDKDLKYGNQAKAWVYRRFIDDGFINPKAVEEWLDQAGFRNGRRTVRQAIKHVEPHVEPQQKKPE